MKIIIILLTATILNSCSFFQSAKTFVDENVEITWKKDKAKDLVPVDSIVVRFNPVYWKEDIVEDSTDFNVESDLIKAGYSIWILEANSIRYNEVRKLDTIIYIYKQR